jgi:hypothetical protein
LLPIRQIDDRWRRSGESGTSVFGNTDDVHSLTLEHERSANQVVERCVGPEQPRRGPRQHQRSRWQRRLLGGRPRRRPGRTIALGQIASRQQRDAQGGEEPGADEANVDMGLCGGRHHTTRHTDRIDPRLTLQGKARRERSFGDTGNCSDLDREATEELLSLGFVVVGAEHDVGGQCVFRVEAGGLTN